MKRYMVLLGVLLYCIMLKAQSVSYSCRYWFDQDHAQAVTGSFSDSTWQTELDVGMLTEGIHKLHLQFADTITNWSSPQTYLFFKTADNLQENLTCHYWFDQNHAQMQPVPFGNGFLLLDVSELDDGIHTINVLLEGDALTATTREVFMKVPVVNPSTEYQYHCWFDNDVNTMQTGWLGAGCFQLEVSQLSIGFHTMNVQLDDNGILSAPQRYMFYKRPFGGCITKWEYWLNGDLSNKHTTDLSPFVDTLDIITLLSVETWPIRSTCFHFQPNGEEPYLNAKNEITFRFWDVDKHYIDKSTFYVDEIVSDPIVADTLERNTTVSIAAPRDNQIHWFKLNVGRGDYLSFQADKACTMQLFAPSGEEVYNVSGPESIVLEGFNTWEDGTYYLAVHDVTGSGESVSITYNWIYRYTISSYDVHLVGNGGCSTITFQGNGFNSLLDAYLVNYQNDTIRQLDIGHESNTTTTISFNFYEENLGVYDAVFEFFEETIRINGALEVQEPVDILLTTTVSYPSAFLINTPCTYTYTITNNGNMSAYAVPIFVYIASHTLDGISHIEFDGLNLPSLVDDMNLDSLSPSQIAELKEWEEELGDDHFFSFFRMLDEETGDTIIARSNFFFISFAPFETKTLSIKITANEPINVWMTIPNETIQPLVFVQNRLNYNQFCCTLDKVECWLRVKSDQLNMASLVADAIALAGLVFNLAGPEGTAISAVLLAIAGYTTIASCFVTVLSELTQKFSDIVCPEESDDWINKILKAAKGNMVSGWKVLCGCIPMHELFKIADPRTVKMSLKFLKKAFTKQMAGLGTDGLAMLPFSDINCLEEFHHKRPNCPPGDPKGGGGTPVQSLDPNDIHGYLSESGSHYMRQEIQNVQYEIEFENDTTLATAAAHTIIVRDTLDATKFDLNSLAARSVTIGDKRLDLNGEQTFARTLDLRPDIYVIAQINQDYDPTTGIIQWTIQSLDPMTMEPTDDPNQGVLPVNYYGDGVGFIDYSVNLLQAFDDGTEISNRAGIIFDQEEVIITPTWTNIVDAVKPTSHIENAVVEADSLNFSFVSSDNRSGVWYHALYYRNDSTYQEWQVRKAQIFEYSFMLKLDDLQTTEYLVMAVDSAGNVEDKPMNAEYVFGLDSLVYYTLTVSDPQGCGEVHGSGTYVAGSHVTIEAIPDDDCYFVQWNDGITDNPRIVHLVQDTTFTALFEFSQTIMTQTTNFAQGWNWWSSYVEAEDLLNQLKTGLGTNGMQIKSQTQFTQYNGSLNLWIGQLNSISNEATYMVQTNAACTVELTGSAASPMAHPVILNHGWSWIGYPNTTALPIVSAFTTITPSNGDQVKTQNGFAQYNSMLNMWVGNLNTITPGMGLQYQSNSSGSITLIYPEGSRSIEPKANITNENNHWVPNIHAYPNNMTVTAVIELDGEELANEHYELGVFANGECRGSARLMYVAPLNRYMAFLTIAGDEASELHFSLYDVETGNVETCHGASLQYETNAIVGDVETPYVISFRSTTGIDELDGRINIFPNPVARGENVTIGLPAVETLRATSVEIVNTIGQAVETVSTPFVQTIPAPKVAGIYTLRITVEGEGTYCRKLVVR